MEQSIKEKYKLSEEEHNEIYKKIEKEVFRNSTPDDQPIAIIVGGQPGCGKGGVISYTQNEAKANGKGIILITTDEYKPYHPNAIEIARKYPTEYVEIVEQDAGPWTGSIMKKAIDERYNFIFEGTLKNDRILDRIKELKQNGFSTIVRVLAVSQLESLLTIHERYQRQMEVLTYGRLISIDHHNKAYAGIPAVVDKIEKSGLCTVEVYIRGKKMEEPIKVYSSKEENERFPTARIALEEYRWLEAQTVRVTAKTRLAKLREGFMKRNANEAEMEQLGKLEEVIENQIEK